MKLFKIFQRKAEPSPVGSENWYTVFMQLQEVRKENLELIKQNVELKNLVDELTEKNHELVKGLTR